MGVPEWNAWTHAFLNEAVQLTTSDDTCSEGTACAGSRAPLTIRSSEATCQMDRDLNDKLAQAAALDAAMAWFSRRSLMQYGSENTTPPSGVLLAETVTRRSEAVGLGKTRAVTVSPS